MLPDSFFWDCLVFNLEAGASISGWSGAKNHTQRCRLSEGLLGSGGRLFLIRHATETPPSSRAPHQSGDGTLSPSELFKSSWRKTLRTRVLQRMPGCRCPLEAGGRGGSRRPPGWTRWASEGRAGRQGINAWRQTQHDTSRRPLLLYLAWFPELS